MQTPKKKSLVWLADIPQLRKSDDFFPDLSINMWPWREAYWPQEEKYQLCVDHNWHGMRAIREQFIMLLRNTAVVVIITLGFMTFGVCHERDNGKGGVGADNFGDFLKRESSK